MRQVYTTGQLSKIFQVAPRTISKWIDSGQMRGYRIPGSNDRRVERRDLLEFVRAHDMAVERIYQEVSRNVLLVSPDTILAERLNAFFGPDSAVLLHHASDFFQAGFLTQELIVAAAVFDLYLGRGEVLSAFRSFRSAPDRQDMPAFVLAAEDENRIQELVQAGFAETAIFVRPFDPQLLAHAILACFRSANGEYARPSRRAATPAT